MSVHPPIKVKPLAQSDTKLRIDRIQVMVVVAGDRAANLIKAIFEQLGFPNLLIAHDADEAFEMMKEVIVDLVVSDAEIKASPLFNDGDDKDDTKIDRPNISGIHLIRHLRHASDSPNPFVPVIMMVNQATEASIIAARDVGTNEILLKPINAAGFCQRLISIIDMPRLFVTAESYKGPDRRRKTIGLPEGITKERRLREIRLFRCDERWRS